MTIEARDKFLIANRDSLISITDFLTIENDRLNMWLLKRIGKNRTYHDLDLVVALNLIRDMKVKVLNASEILERSFVIEQASSTPRLFERLSDVS